MPDTRTVKKIFNWNTLTKRSQGRPKYRWEDNIKQDICQMKIKNWTACVQDRGKWKEVVEKAKTFNWEVQRLEEEVIQTVSMRSNVWKGWVWKVYLLGGACQNLCL
jgi:hypothetical protein